MMMEINLIRGDAVLAHNNLEKWANPGQVRLELIMLCQLIDPSLGI